MICFINLLPNALTLVFDTHSTHVTFKSKTLDLHHAVSDFYCTWNCTCTLESNFVDWDSCSCELFYFILLLDHGEVIYVVCLCILVCETNYSSEKGRNTENIADADRSGL